MSIGFHLSLAAFLFLLLEVWAVWSAVHAVMHVRTSQGAIAWAISLVTVPYIALPLYLVLGRKRFHGYLTLRHIREKSLEHVIDACRRQAHEKGLLTAPADGVDEAFNRLADEPFTRFNRNRLLINGEQTFDAIFREIDAARDYLLIQFFIVRDDGIGRDLQSRLMAAAGRGVRVFFLYDEIGCHTLPASYVDALREAGVHAVPFHTTKGRANRFQLNFRNHRKTVVADGRVAFLGGHNVGDEYMSRSTRFGFWRDTHVEIRGPVVQAVQFCFVQDWYWATGDIPDLDWTLRNASESPGRSLIIASGPADDLETCNLMFTQAIHAAKERIWIASPYFVPDERVLGALKLAALRGVDVRIILPEKEDHLLVYLAAFSFYQAALPLGIHILRYTKGFMHQKVFLVDHDYAGVGTANLDNRSFRLNFEATLIDTDTEFIADVERMLREDFEQCRPASLEELAAKPFRFHLGMHVARLFEPIL